jgi:hypothetical protein
MKFNVDNADELLQGMSGNIWEFVKGERKGRSDGKDLLRVRIEYSLAA